MARTLVVDSIKMIERALSRRATAPKAFLQKQTHERNPTGLTSSLPEKAARRKARPEDKKEKPPVVLPVFLSP